MSVAFPPSENFNTIYYNKSFFFFNNNEITLSYLNANYLHSIGVALSTATITTFTGAVSITGLLTLSGGISLTGAVVLDSLVVNGISSFIGQSTFTLPPILPAGYQLITNGTQTLSGSKTFSTNLTTYGISDVLLISSPIITASTSCFSPYFSASNSLGTTLLYATTITGLLQTTSLNVSNNAIITGTLTGNNTTIINSTLNVTGITTTNATNIQGVLTVGTINNIAQTIPLVIYSGAVPLPTSGTGGNAGLMLGWNSTGGGGECDFISMGQGGMGGFNFYTVNSAVLPCNLLISLNPTSMTLNAPFNPTSTTTFNSYHPTTTLGSNISTNTSQYATVGYVNTTAGSSALLASNNIWTGQNNFYNTAKYINTGSAVGPVAVGCGGGANNNIIIGDSASLTTSTGTSIAIGFFSQYNSIASNNISIGQNCLSSMTTGTANISIGSTSGTVITTGQSNVALGNNAWGTGGNNWSFCTSIGYNSQPTGNNQVVLGTGAETVVCPNNINCAGIFTFTGTGSTRDYIYNIPSLTTTTTFSNIVRYLTFTPAVTGFGLIMPLPSSINYGQTFVIRRLQTGGGGTTALSAGSFAAVWLLNNATSATTVINITTVWQFTFFSNGTYYIQTA